MKKFLNDQSGAVVIGLAFVLLFGTALGATLDQTVPEVNKAVNKYIVKADHSAPQPFEDKPGMKKK